MKKSSFYHTPLYSTPHLGGSHRNIGTPFGTEKLEWCRYPKVKKFRKYVYSFWRDPRTWQMDRQTLHDSKDRACIASHGKNENTSRQFNGLNPIKLESMWIKICNELVWSLQSSIFSQPPWCNGDIISWPGGQRSTPGYLTLMSFTLLYDNTNVRGKLCPC